jgi:hypothetical protein
MELKLASVLIVLAPWRISNTVPSLFPPPSVVTPNRSPPESKTTGDSGNEPIGDPTNGAMVLSR